MPTLQVSVWAESTGVGVSQWAAETMGIWQDMGGLTTQQIDNKVRERIWEIAPSMSIINKKGAGPKQCDVLIDCCITRISDLASERPLWTWYMADKTTLDGQKLKAVLDEFVEVGIRQRTNRLNETPTRKRRLVHVGMNFIAPMLLLLILMMCRSRRWQGRNIGLQVFADKGALRCLQRFPCPAIYLYHRLCGSRHCWEKGGWKQYSAIPMALAWGWWIDTSNSYINGRYNHLSIMTAAIASLPDPSRIIREPWGFLGEPTGDCGPHARNVTAIFDNNTAAGWVKAAMKLINPTLFHVVYRGQQADGTDAAQTPMLGSRSYLGWGTSPHHEPRIQSMISGRNWMMIVRCGAQIHECSRWGKQASNSLNWSFKTGLSDSSDTLKSSETVLLVSLRITRKVLLLMRMWLGYRSTITLWIHLLQTLWPIGSVQAAAQLQISRCEDGMHWLDGSSRICILGGYFCGSLEGGRMGDNFEFFGEVLGLFLVFCLFYYYIIHIHAW